MNANMLKLILKVKQGFMYASCLVPRLSKPPLLFFVRLEEPGDEADIQVAVKYIAPTHMGCSAFFVMLKCLV